MNNGDVFQWFGAKINGLNPKNENKIMSLVGCEGSTSQFGPLGVKLGYLPNSCDTYSESKDPQKIWLAVIYKTNLSPLTSKTFEAN